MINVAVIGGSRLEVKTFIETAKNEYEEPLKFHVFDREENIDEEGLWQYYPCESDEDMALAAVKYVYEGHADILVKGIVPTRTVLKAVLHPDYSLKNQALLSHVAQVHLPKLNRPLLLTDAAMNLAPDTNQLIEITNNVLEVAKKMGMEKPKVALLSSAETINPKMLSSVNAEKITKHFSAHQEAVVYGPLSFDLALSKESVRHKGFEGPVAGDADILVVPNIDVGNVLYKALVLFGQATIGGIIVGTKAPIVLPSRSDSIESKMLAFKFALSQVSQPRTRVR